MIGRVEVKTSVPSIEESVTVVTPFSLLLEGASVVDCEALVVAFEVVVQDWELDAVSEVVGLGVDDIELVGVKELYTLDVLETVFDVVELRLQELVAVDEVDTVGVRETVCDGVALDVGDSEHVAVEEVDTVGVRETVRDGVALDVGDFELVGVGEIDEVGVTDIDELGVGLAEIDEVDVAELVADGSAVFVSYCTPQIRISM